MSKPLSKDETIVVWCFEYQILLVIFFGIYTNILIDRNNCCRGSHFILLTLILTLKIFIYAFYIPNLSSPYFAILTLPKEERDKIAKIFIYYKKKQTTDGTGRMFSINNGATTKAQLQFIDISWTNTRTAEQRSKWL